MALHPGMLSIGRHNVVSGTGKRRRKVKQAYSHELHAFIALSPAFRGQKTVANSTHDEAAHAEVRGGEWRGGAFRGVFHASPYLLCAKFFVWTPKGDLASLALVKLKGQATSAKKFTHAH